MLRLYGQAVKTPPSHGGNSGSNPDRVTNYNNKKETLLSHKVSFLYLKLLAYRTKRVGKSRYNR